MTANKWRLRPVVLVLLLLASACGNEKSQTPQSATAEPAAKAPQPSTADESESRSAGAPGVKLCEHRVPAELCTKCNPDLVAVFKETGDWCEEHGLPESHCYECNPGLTFAARSGPPAEAWCNEHGVPEAKCTKCKPQLIAKFIEAKDYCREHGLPESVCPFCHPEVLKAAGHELPVFPKPGTTVKLASPETEHEAGIETTTATQRKFARTLDVVGQLHFNENRLAKLSARGEALIVEVKVDIGDEVKRGQPLVVLASGAVGQDQSRLAAAKARFEAARAALAREQALQQSGISSKRSVEQAQTELAAAQADYDAARAALRAAGAGEAGAGGQYVLAAPFNGTVVAREAVTGKSVSAETTLIEVADLSTMWAVLDVPEEASATVRPGQRVTLAFEGLGGATREGVIGRMGAALDAHTRTVRARVDVPNPDRSLRAGLFIRAKIAVVGERDALLLPRDAIQRAEGRSLVFVRTAPGQYDPVAVELGARADDEVEVLKGISPGAEVVTTGAFALKTEILKDSIGAGCADD